MGNKMGTAKIHIFMQTKQFFLVQIVKSIFNDFFVDSLCLVKFVCDSESFELTGFIRVFGTL